MSIVLEGIVRGGKIELVDGPELMDGQRVQVVLEPHETTTRRDAVGAIPEEGVVHTPLDDPVLVDLLARIRSDQSPLDPSPTGAGRKSTAGMLSEDATWDEDLREVLHSRKWGSYREPRE
jgi:hypothetical protein